MTVTEISQRLDIHKSTVSRILAALLDDGMVWHNAETGRYSLGMALVEMSGVALGQIDVRAAALPHMEYLSHVSGETVAVTVCRSREAITVAQLPSPQPIRHVVWIGRRLPLHSTAAGKVFLAARHNRGEEWRALLDGTEGSLDVTGHASFEREIAQAARRGYAMEHDEFEAGTSAVAAPVLDATGEAAAALSMSGPSGRFDEQARLDAVHALMATADAVAADLGLRRPAVEATT